MSFTRVPLILGTASFGKEGTVAARLYDVPTCQKAIDLYVAHGHKYIDTAPTYGAGSCEKFLSECDIPVAKEQALIDTKVHPFRGPGNLKEENVRLTLLGSIKRLGGYKVRVFYLHAPDRKTPFDETAEAVNTLYKEGHFEEFGLSNFSAFEISEMWTICKERGYVLPTVYQGQYNLIQRGAEVEMIHALRKYKIRFAAWSPLAGGLFSGNVKSKEEPDLKGTRFDPDTESGRFFKGLFLSGTEIDGVHYLENVIGKYDLSLAEVALRWIQHHSVLTPDDYVIIGCSKPEHIEYNCVYSAMGPLPDEVVEACETAWLIAKAKSPPAFQPFK